MELLEGRERKDLSIILNRFLCRNTSNNQINHIHSSPLYLCHKDNDIDDKDKHLHAIVLPFLPHRRMYCFPCIPEIVTYTYYLTRKLDISQATDLEIAKSNDIIAFRKNKSALDGDVFFIHRDSCTFNDYEFLSYKGDSDIERLDKTLFDLSLDTKNNRATNSFLTGLLHHFLK